METPNNAREKQDAGEEFARQIAKIARASRDRIAERIEAEGDTTVAWFYRSTIV